MQEARLDWLEHIDDDLIGLLARPDVIATCRSVSEHGGFRGTEAERFALLQRMLHRGPGYLDVELGMDEALRRTLFAGRGVTRMILSHHEWQPWSTPELSSRLTELGRALGDAPADMLKLAVTIDDAADQRALLQALAREPRPVLRLAMGPAGLLSRALPERFGSPWTYVVRDGAPEIAPGQLTITQARRWRVAAGSPLTPLGLLGGPGVLSSPGPVLYNLLFADRALAFMYLPVVTSQPDRTLGLLEALGFGGASVTMPAKETLLAELTVLQSPADRVRAVNTVRFDRGSRIGLNTDVAAVRTLLEPFRGSRALVLGAGGAARAAVVALAELGCPVCVSGRSPESLARLAAAFGVRTLPWQRRADEPFELLVHATPCGADGQSEPMPPSVSWSNRVVLDMVVSLDPTPLLRRVRAQGGQGIAGIEMWLIQGAVQLAALTGAEVSPEELGRYVPAWQEQSHA